MAEIQIPIRIEGTLIREEFGENETAKLQDYRIEAITKPGAYVLIDPLPYDFIVQNYAYRITEAFDGYLGLGDDQNQTRYLADTDFVKTVGKKSKAASRLIEQGKIVKLYLGAGTTGKIEFHMTGFLLRPSLL